VAAVRGAHTELHGPGAGATIGRLRALTGADDTTDRVSYHGSRTCRCGLSGTGCGTARVGSTDVVDTAVGLCTVGPYTVRWPVKCGEKSTDPARIPRNVTPCQRQRNYTCSPCCSQRISNRRSKNGRAGVFISPFSRVPRSDVYVLHNGTETAPGRGRASTDHFRFSASYRPRSHGPMPRSAPTKSRGQAPGEWRGAGTGKRRDAVPRGARHVGSRARSPVARRTFGFASGR
jgi:hypothetical protein